MVFASGSLLFILGFCPTWRISHWMLSVFTRCLWKMVFASGRLLLILGFAQKTIFKILFAVPTALYNRTSQSPPASSVVEWLRRLHLKAGGRGFESHPSNSLHFFHKHRVNTLSIQCNIRQVGQNLKWRTSSSKTCVSSTSYMHMVFFCYFRTKKHYLTDDYSPKSVRTTLCKRYLAPGNRHFGEMGFVRYTL